MPHKNNEYYKRCALNGISATSAIRDIGSNSSSTKFRRYRIRTEIDEIKVKTILWKALKMTLI